MIKRGRGLVSGFYDSKGFDENVRTLHGLEMDTVSLTSVCMKQLPHSIHWTSHLTHAVKKNSFLIAVIQAVKIDLFYFK